MDRKLKAPRQQMKKEKEIKEASKEKRNCEVMVKNPVLEAFKTVHRDAQRTVEKLKERLKSSNSQQSNSTCQESTLLWSGLGWSKFRKKCPSPERQVKYLTREEYDMISQMEVKPKTHYYKSEKRHDDNYQRNKRKKVNYRRYYKQTNENNLVHLEDFYDVSSIKFNIELDVGKYNGNEMCRYCIDRTKHSDCEELKFLVYCSNCGRNGVRINNCPRCSRAYFSYLESINETDYECDESRTAKIISSFTDRKKISPTILNWQSKDSYWRNGWQIDEKKHFQHTNDYSKDFKNLLAKIKHLSTDNQRSIVIHFTLERERWNSEKHC